MSDNTLSTTYTPAQLPAFVHIPSRESLITVCSTTIPIDVDYQRESYTREQITDNTLSPTITTTQLPALVNIPSHESLNTVSSTTISIDVDYQRERYREQIPTHNPYSPNSSQSEGGILMDIIQLENALYKLPTFLQEGQPYDFYFQRESYREQIRQKCESLRVLRAESKHSRESLIIEAVQLSLYHTHTHMILPPLIMKNTTHFLYNLHQRKGNFGRS